MGNKEEIINFVIDKLYGEVYEQDKVIYQSNYYAFFEYMYNLFNKNNIGNYIDIMNEFIIYVVSISDTINMDSLIENIDYILSKIHLNKFGKYSSHNIKNDLFKRNSIN